MGLDHPYPQPQQILRMRKFAIFGVIRIAEYKIFPALLPTDSINN